MPVPVGPVRQLIQMLYWDPDEFGKQCESRYADLQASAARGSSVPAREDPTLRHWVLDDDPHATPTPVDG